MKYYRKLFTGKEVEHPAYVTVRVRHGAVLPGLYAVVLEEDGHVSFLQTAMLKLTYDRSSKAMVIGVAYGRDGAIELIRSLTERALLETGSPAISGLIRKPAEKG